MSTRNIPILSISQALSASGAPVVVLLGGIIGTALAPSPALATLPISLMVIGLAVSTIPAALLMKRIGRRRGFMAAALIASAAALLAAFAITQDSFLLFCSATFLIGSNNAFVQQYRFAASESVPAKHTGRAISFVLVGGIFAGILGPEIATRTQGLIPGWMYTGSFVFLAMIYVAAVTLLAFLKDTAPPSAIETGDERKLTAVFTQPVFLVAVLSAAVAYGVMNFLMTATPLYMHQHGFNLDQTARVVQGHIVAMYLPSLFSGILIERFKAYRVMIAGIFFLLTCVFLALISTHLIHFGGALVLLGIGWNFLFVGATALLTRSYFPAERFKAQASNDFIVFTVTAFTSLSAGTVLYYANWRFLTLLNIPFLLVTLAAVILLQSRARQPHTATQQSGLVK